MNVFPSFKCVCVNNGQVDKVQLYLKCDSCDVAMLLVASVIVISSFKILDMCLQNWVSDL
jgi:hypothetical protein